MFIDKFGNHWYKGNLHTHTTLSDGKLSPDDTKRFYRSQGYDFLALTDHWIYGEGSESDESGLLILSGTEYNFNDEDTVRGVFHIVGVGMTDDPMKKIGRESTAQETIDEILTCGGAAILAHPAWSLNTCEMLMGFERISALEIFNSVSDLPRNCRPYSGIVVDQLASRGVYHKLAATDDTHFYLGEEARSYIYVNLYDKPFNRENLVAAIIAGEYIATQGPIFTTRVDGGEYVVECGADSNVVGVAFFTNRPWENQRSVMSDDGEPLTEARFPIHKNDRFVRAELYTQDRKTGWSQITPLKAEN